MQKFADGTKQCCTCKVIKPETDFAKDRTRCDGLMNQCKVCKRKYRISDMYHKRELELEKTPHWRERRIRYSHTDKGKHTQSKRDHHDRGCLNSYNGLLTFEQWNTILKNQGFKCAVCRRGFSEELKYCKDCIIPISKGGNLTFDNTQALCLHCNAVKHADSYSGLGNRWRAEFIS